MKHHHCAFKLKFIRSFTSIVDYIKYQYLYLSIIQSVICGNNKLFFIKYKFAFLSIGLIKNLYFFLGIEYKIFQSNVFWIRWSDELIRLLWRKSTYHNGNDNNFVIFIIFHLVYMCAKLITRLVTADQIDSVYLIDKRMVKISPAHWIITGCYNVLDNMSTFSNNKLVNNFFYQPTYTSRDVYI